MKLNEIENSIIEQCQAACVEPRKQAVEIIKEGYHEVGQLLNTAPEGIQITKLIPVVAKACGISQRQVWKCVALQKRFNTLEDVPVKDQYMSHAELHKKYCEPEKEAHTCEFEKKVTCKCKICGKRQKEN